ncbi:lipid kinase [uncultured Enterovirga sp.]|uniref:lipid kinase n=1 Tax=uncultured Enterovirga sp. TaxID=2026352 RepID=UPI0035CB2AD9
MQAVEDDISSPASTSGPRRALLLLNPKARSGSQPIDAALGILIRGGLAVEELSCRSPEEMSSAIRSRASDLQCVIAGGGDGTLNGIAAALAETRLPLGILPLGTANDLARTLGIGPALPAAAQVIVDGAIRDIDLGEVNGHLFFNVASIGFSAELASELTAEAKRRWGTLGYALAGAKLLARTRPFTAFIEHDGRTEKVKTVQISVGNGRHYGGGMTVDETAEPDDGKLHLYSLEVGHWSRLVTLVPALRRGTHGAATDVRAFTTPAVTIRTRRSRSVNTDGELTTATPAVFRVIPKAVRIFAPPHPRNPTT